MTQDDWSTMLEGHPIFTFPKGYGGPTGQSEESLELSTNTLKKSMIEGRLKDGLPLSGRRQVMVLKDSDLIVAAGCELRITSLSDSKLGRSTNKSFKILNTPNIQFGIHQLALNPSGKLIAVAGAYQVAVVVLPRAGYSKLVPSSVDCKSIQVGFFYHHSHSSAPIAKIEWHPWGEAGSTLMVMTVDGKLREYDISVDTEEPQQVLSFVSEKKTSKKGKADWGPLTVYAVMRSGDIYAICPYMPKNASVPSSYVHALECFISAKQEFLSQGTSSGISALSTLYDYQRKYVTALLKQLPPGTVYPAISRSFSMHPPMTIKSQPMRQGPFLLQPSPRSLEDSEGGDATDIAYLAFIRDDDDEDTGETERLGIVIVSYQDGKVDVCLDVEKVEARWESKQDKSQDLPMLAVYECIDLDLISMLKQTAPLSSGTPILDLLQANHPVLLMDPIHDDTVYVYHAFGVHVLDFGDLLQCLTSGLRADDDDGVALNQALQKSAGTHVVPLLNTYSVDRRCSNPIIAISVPNDVYLSYSILILTSVFRFTSFPLNLRTDLSLSRTSPHLPDKNNTSGTEDFLAPIEGPLAYISLLGTEPFVPPPALSRPSGLPSNPRIAVGTPNTKTDFVLTPETLRYLGSTIEGLTSQIHEIILAYKATEVRAELQAKEFERQQQKCSVMLDLIERLSGSRNSEVKERLERIREAYRALASRLDHRLQTLMQQASPKLSEYETKWFGELRRMKAEIAGTGRYDEQSLAARTSLLKREYDRILPSLNDMAAKEAERKKHLSENGLGLSQAFQFGERSNQERTKIAELEEEIVKMASKLELSLARPPSLRESP
ncbi:uncharacterized protein BJ212DRAFT_1339285 [Suillus subaureus]|uniref:Uncharacterized protein n=1 Tax=Suillus subaureus TaxID=48587 RepID=A0A9P7EFL7_9AGAM|nr:uncharacterized protein BJ212DRAFT_1339285 [Suillus subaureus]KAG1820314.1 hypothetical protein BJ212DRAFT_1339285 [Suillus subaureus]